MDPTKHSNDQTKSEKTSLLMLNDHCLMKIFQFLNVQDFVSLNETCNRLRNVCASVCALKYKEIEVSVRHKEKSRKQFSDILSVIGQHVLDIEVDDAQRLTFEVIREKCNKINSIKFWRPYFNNSINFSDFKNLKELKVYDSSMSLYGLKNWLSSIPDLESLEWNCEYEPGFMALLKMLPKLQSLRLSFLPRGIYLSRDLQHLLRLDGLTKFSFRSRHNCNRLLMELGKKINLVELNVVIPFDGDTLGTIKSFQNLEVLSMVQMFEDWKISWFSDATVFPSKLKHIKVAGIKLPCITFLSLVGKLKFLEEFDIGFGDIFLSKCKLSYHNSIL